MVFFVVAEGALHLIVVGADGVFVESVVVVLGRLERGGASLKQVAPDPRRLHIRHLRVVVLSVDHPFNLSL